MNLPKWDWSEARRQFELRIPGLAKTRLATLDAMRKAGHAWQRKEGT